MTRRCKSGGNIKEGNNQSKRNQLNQPNRIMLVERDIIRHLIIPRENGERPATTFISESQFDHIKRNSRSVPDLREKQDTENEKKIFEEEKRKYEALNREVQQLKKKKAAEITEEERQEREKILARTEQLRREEEDIIKQCNSLILSAKCKAIQDAQIVEKQRLRQKQKQQEESLDSKLETEHQQALQALQRKREEEWARRRKYAESVLNQIQYNEEKRLQHLKIMQKENKVLKLKAQKQEDEDKLYSAREMEKRVQMKMQNERINEEIRRNKERERELEKLENLKIQEYMKRKLQEEKEREKQKIREKQLEERELARLWKLQKSSQSLLQSKDELIHERQQEQLQRKWRQKELEKIRRRMREIENINRIRERQIEEKRASLICSSVDKKEEANKIAVENQKLRDELASLQTKQKQITEKYKMALREQITEKEQKRRTQRQQILKEGEDLLEELQKHDRIIKETMKKKMDQIRSSNVPEMYVQGIEKKMHLS